MNEGPAAWARFNQPTGVAVDASGTVYVADQLNHRIRKIANGTVTTLAGDGGAAMNDGPAAWARFNKPTGVAFVAAGLVLVADPGNQRIRLVAPPP
jgi:DNA-binding beta-propeller fold protein YncE